MAVSRTIGYDINYGLDTYGDTEPHHRLRQLGSGRWCVEGPGVPCDLDTAVDTRETAEALRALLQQAYHLGRVAGEHEKVCEFRALLGL